MIKRKNMDRKFINSFIAFIVVPFFLIMLIANIMYEKKIILHYNDKVQQIMEQLSNDIDNELRRITLYAAKIANEKELLANVNDWYDENDATNKLKKSKKIEDKLDYIFAYQGEVNSIIFFSKDGKIFNYGDEFYVNDDKIKESSWYKHSLKNKGKVYSSSNFKINEDEKNNEQFKFLVGISPDPCYVNSATEFLYLEVKTKIFNAICSKYKNDSVGKMIIVDGEGNIVVYPDKNLLGKNIVQVDFINEIVKNKDKNFYKKNINREVKYIATHTSEKTGWTIISIIDYKMLLKDIAQIGKIFFVIFLIFIILFILYSQFFFKDIVKPISALVNKMMSIKKGKFDEITSVNTNIYEIEELQNNYNDMIYNIKKLMAERDLKERERSREEIKALQAQINPHFIYNTLNLIKLMAMISKCDNIRRVTDSFMKLLSATFKSQATFITLREELEYLDSYTEIMKARFGEDFSLVVEIDENIKELYVIKLILQPIVENAIIHGINLLENDKKIVVSGAIIEDKLILGIKDNGVGMTKEEIEIALNEIDSCDKGSHGIGVKNVKRRIELNCGEEYGIKIESEKNKFTKVKLILPIKKVVD